MVEEFKIRLAKLDDMKDVFDLSNDVTVRQNSFTSEKIDWEKHQVWFKDKLKNKACIFYIITDDKNNLISQVRIEKENNTEAIISISIIKAFRGKGYGAKILKKLSEKVIWENNLKKIYAYVKSENIASQKSFEKAGYILMDNDSNKLRYLYSGK